MWSINLFPVNSEAPQIRIDFRDCWTQVLSKAFQRSQHICGIFPLSPVSYSCYSMRRFTSRHRWLWLSITSYTLRILVLFIPLLRISFRSFCQFSQVRQLSGWLSSPISLALNMTSFLIIAKKFPQSFPVYKLKRSSCCHCLWDFLVANSLLLWKFQFNSVKLHFFYLYVFSSLSWGDCSPFYNKLDNNIARDPILLCTIY